MSFLLDALGKADNDRRSAEVPELRTYNQGHRSPFRRLLRILIWVSLVLLSFELGYFLRPYLEINLSGEPLAQKAEVSRMRSDVANVAPTPEQAPPVVVAPPEVMARVLELEVISYSESPDVRFAMINGSLVHEGDVLDTGEHLIKIEPNAVVLDRAGKQIRISM